MAYYRLSQVVKMRREALGLARNDFDEKGPSFMTVYRMETGKVRTNEKMYRKVTRVMGEEESTRRGILKTKDIRVLRLTNEITDGFLHGDYKKVEKLLEKLKALVDCDVKRNQRYIDYVSARLQYNKGEIVNTIYAEIIRQGLYHGDMDLEILLERRWPFLERECNYIIELAALMRKETNLEQLKFILNQFERDIASEYMEKEFRNAYIVCARFRISDVLGNLGYHREAIAIDEETCFLCKKEVEYRHMAEIYYDIFWNYWMLKKKETLTEQEETRCKECLLNAYYLNKAWYRPKELYKIRIRECYPEEME